MASLWKRIMKTILVTDDDRDVRAIIRMRLEAARYRILEASDGQSALELAQTEHPDLLLLDMTMPGISGVEVVERLRGNPATAHIPVMLISGAEEIADKQFALSVKANDYLVKPIDGKELLERVRSLLG